MIKGQARHLQQLTDNIGDATNCIVALYLGLG